MTVTLLFNIAGYSTLELNSFSLMGYDDNGFRALSTNFTDINGNSSYFNVFQLNGAPKIKYKNTVYDFQNDVTPSLESGSITNSLIVKSTDGNACALRIASNTTGDPRVIFSGSSSTGLLADPRVAYLSDAFNVYNEMSSSTAYAGTFLFPLPNLDNVIDFDIAGGLQSQNFKCNLSLSTGNNFSLTINPKNTPVVDGSFTFSKVLTINYNDGTPMLVYDVTDNFQLFFAQLSGLTQVNQLEYTYDINNAVSAGTIDGSFDGVRIQLYTEDDIIEINGSSWSATPYDAVLDFDSITRATPSKMATKNGRIVEFDKLHADLKMKSAQQAILQNYRMNGKF